mgnify:CR=1 FL=1
MPGGKINADRQVFTKTVLPLPFDGLRAGHFQHLFAEQNDEAGFSAIPMKSAGGTMPWLG